MINEPSKEEKIVTINNMLANEGISVEELAAFQTRLEEVKEDPVLQPQDIAGVSNDPAKDNASLTAELAAFKTYVDDIFTRHNLK